MNIPEGPPVPAPSTAAPLNLSPDSAALHYPPNEPIVDPASGPDAASGPPQMTIYQVDVDSIPEKPWRMPGADLSDWFNYGFDEQSWAVWCGKKNEMDVQRGDMQQQVQEGAIAPPENPMMSMFGPGMMGMPPMEQWQMMMGGPQGADAMSMMMPGMPPMPGMDLAMGMPTEKEEAWPDDGDRRRDGRWHQREDDDNPGRRYNDRDTAQGAGGALDLSLIHI